MVPHTFVVPFPACEQSSSKLLAYYKTTNDNIMRLVGPFLNRYTGRKGTIFVTCLVSALSCLGQAFAQNWKQLLATRILLGIGIGPKSATIPVYAAECVPAPIRGALVMQWQVWTAFGIFLGFICGVIFRDTGVSVLRRLSHTFLTMGSSAGQLETHAW